MRGRQDLPPALRSALEPLRPSGADWAAKCPAHEDHHPSLTVGVTDTGKVLLRCQAGCEQASVLAALEQLGVRSEDLRGDEQPGRAEWTPHGDAIAVYDYCDENGATLFQVLRTADKQFPQRRPDRLTKSGWTWKLGDCRRVPYKLPALIAGVAAGRPVWIVEGEKDTETLIGTGQVATCNPGGAGKWRAEYAALFAGARVSVVADRDRPGQAHARQVADGLAGVAAQVRVVEPAEPHKDITEHLRAGLTIHDVVVTRQSGEPIKPDLAPDLHAILESTDPDFDWLVPGLLERGDRLVLTGWEGMGKSWLVRQFALCMAAGIHPFTAEPYGFLRVLMIDAENSQRQTRRVLRRMYPALEALGASVPRGGCRFILRPEGFDLTQAEDADWLLERVIAHQPDVLFIGPLYRLHAADPKEEGAARAMVGAIDRARVRANCAVVLEAHAGHASGLAGRSVRPLGSSLLMRWPEFGYGIAPIRDETDPEAKTPVALTSWRGDRDARDWPKRLRHGMPDELPWQIDGGFHDSVARALARGKVSA